jgi:hypothetical protein
MVINATYSFFWVEVKYFEYIYLKINDEVASFW